MIARTAYRIARRFWSALLCVVIALALAFVQAPATYASPDDGAAADAAAVPSADAQVSGKSTSSASGANASLAPGEGAPTGSTSGADSTGSPEGADGGEDAVDGAGTGGSVGAGDGGSAEADVAGKLAASDDDASAAGPVRAGASGSKGEGEGEPSSPAADEVLPDAKANLVFEKVFYGQAAFNEFTFSLVALDAEAATAGDYGVIRGGSEASDPLKDEDGLYIVDNGVDAFTIHAQVTPADMHDGKADVVFPQIRFTHDGVFFYRVQEEAPNAPDADMRIAVDRAQLAVIVTVADGRVESVSHHLLYPDASGALEDLGETEDLSFYNNSAVSFSQVPTYAYAEQGSQTSVYPRGKKDVNGNTDQLRAGDYAFELLDESGEVVATATNDEDGDISFFDEGVDAGLTFSEPGDYYYQIREVAGNAPGVTYDPTTVLMTVSVEQVGDTVAGDADAYHLAATVAYDNPTNVGNTDYAEFHNLKKTTNLKVLKQSAQSGEGLVGCTYTLWMVDAHGDVMIASAESDADGWMTFEDVSLPVDSRFYLKESAAPSGHLVNPYRSDYFTVESLRQTGKTADAVELEAPFSVFDDPTSLTVAKLDAGTHEYVKGATLRIVEKSTGAVVDEWTLGGKSHKTVGLLDVNTVYILQEAKSPAGYQKSAPVEFRLNENAGAGIELLSGTRTTVNAKTVTNAERFGDYGINLYNRGTDTTVHKPAASQTPRTADPTPLHLVLTLAILSLLTIGAATHHLPRKQRNNYSG